MALFDEVLEVARNYLGPAAEEYVQRRCRVSLKIRAEDLKPMHLQRLADGIELTAEVYMGQEKARKFKLDVLKLVS